MHPEARPTPSTAESTGPAGAAHFTSEVEGQLDSLLDEMSAAAAQLAQELDTPAASPTPQLPATSTLPANTPTAGTPRAPSKADATDPAEVGEIDAQLARLTESMLEESAAAAPAPGAPVPGVAPATEAAAQIAEPPAPAAPAPAAPAAPVSPAAPALVAAPQSADEPAGSPLLQAVLGALARPMRGRSKSLRDTVGWAAIVTLFWAAGLWGYITFLHVPPAPQPPPNAPAILTGEKAEAVREGAPAAPHAGATRPGGH